MRITVFVALLAIAFVLNISCGAVALPWYSILFSKVSLDDASKTILEWRLLHAFASLFVGAGLALVGSVLQRLLRNPLADPFVLGVTSGGTLFAVASIIWGFPFFMWGVPVRILAALAGSGITIVLVFAARRMLFKSDDAFGVPLAGMLLNAFFGALLTFGLTISDPSRLGESFRWLVGDIQMLSLGEVVVVGSLVIVVGAVLLRMAPLIATLAFGDEFANSLGFSAKRLRRAGILLVAVLTAVVVSVAGSIGFVGLVIPHAARWLVRSHIAAEWLVSAILGAALVLVADTLARVVVLPSELPVGIFTALIGVPLLVAMAIRWGGVRGRAL